MKEELLKIGFEELPHFTIMGSMHFDLGRSRQLSVGCVGTPNEMMWICEVTPDGKQINDLVCVHNFDYDGKLKIEKVKSLIKLLENKPNRVAKRD